MENCQRKNWHQYYPGARAKIESEHSQIAQYPRAVIEKLMQEAKAKGKDYIEFTEDQLRRMSLEQRNSREEQQRKEKPQKSPEE